MSWEASAANSTYTKQQVLDVGDVPGHQLRIYELHRTFPSDKPNCEGLKRVEQWSRGLTDYTDGNGSLSGYTVTILENGDKIFGKVSGTSQTTTNSDGSKTSTFTGVVTYTGGTGKYQRVRGIQRDIIAFDLEKNFNQQRAEAEYWFEK
ncbi:hypothetical protein Mnod_8254 (plasmid) [Methylobacterium nodulans ORS 2060]|uniref:Uncharacterized protein n=2 Tax=Methylobacterium nodulans TaxID=114616 RepID=B8IVG9_METNO|nr:hypothetical protein Mnod_8254 [Methylobacterium nodulans ORS 2060]